MTPAAAVIINAAGKVRTAEEAVQSAARHLRSIAERLDRSGASFNSLGELQGNGPDVAIATLEAAADAFKSAWRYLSPSFAEWTESEQEWIRHEVDKSPRLLDIVRRIEDGSAW